MKKLLSIMLVVVMLLSTFVLSSCDFLTNIFTSSQDEVGTTTTEEEAPIIEEPRTTITAEEWENALKCTNFTLNIMLNEQASITFMADDTKGYLDFLGAVKSYADTTKGIRLMAYANTYYATKLEEEDSGLSLSELDMDVLPGVDKFDDFIYNEETKVYTYEDDSVSIEAAFLDGKLVYITGTAFEVFIVDGTLEVTNIGTTTLELPEYIDLSDGKVDLNNADNNAVTTVTKEQFEAVFEMTNFTIESSNGIELLIMKHTETANESVYHTGILVYTQKFQTLLDGVWFDVKQQYNYQTGDSFYVAQESTSQENKNGLNELFPNVLFEDLVYNEEGRYYEGTVDGAQTYWYFTNGQLTHVNILNLTDEGTIEESMVTISNIGTTVVEIPEYTIVE